MPEPGQEYAKVVKQSVVFDLQLFFYVEYFGETS